jgi:hypothetical protein
VGKGGETTNGTKIVADEMMNEEKITVSREEALGAIAKESADLSVASLWDFAHEQVSVLPSSPEVTTRKDSNTKTLEWQNGNAYWQHKRW